MNKFITTLALVASLVTTTPATAADVDFDKAMQGIALELFSGILKKVHEPKRHRHPPVVYYHERETYIEREVIREHRPRHRPRRSQSIHCDQHPWARPGVLQCDGDQIYWYRGSFYTTHCDTSGRFHPAFEGIGFGIVCRIR